MATMLEDAATPVPPEGPTLDFGEVYMASYTILVHTAQGRLRSLEAAEDVVQTVARRMWPHWPRLQRQWALKQLTLAEQRTLGSAYLYRGVLNEITSAGHQQRVRHDHTVSYEAWAEMLGDSDLVDGLLIEQGTTDDPAGIALLRTELQAIFQQLSPLSRTILRGRLMGYKFRELVELLHLPVSHTALRQRLAREMAALAERDADLADLLSTRKR